jgi:phage I-like protein
MFTKASNDTWIDVVKIGKWKGHENGEFQITEKSLKEIDNNFKKSGVQIVVDYNHSSLDTPEAIAAGWIDTLRINNNKGVLQAKVVWTKKAKKQKSK